MVDTESLLADLVEQDFLEIGCFLMTRNKHEKAKNFLRKVLDINANSIEAMTNLGAAHFNMGELAEAKSILQGAVSINPSYAAAWLNLGSVYARLDQFEESRTFLNIASSLNPPFKSDVVMCQAMNAQYRGDIQAAIREYQEAADLGHPMAKQSLGMMHMLLGDWEKGLPLYEDRLNTRSVFPTNLPIWDGDLRRNPKSVLVVSEQGYGDMIQYARYGQMLRILLPGAKIFLYCIDGLKSMMAKFSGFDGIFEQKDGIVPQCEVQIAMMSLALVYYNQNGKLFWPCNIHWPIIPDSPVSVKRKRVGICWRGNPGHPHDRYRSMSLSTLGKDSGSVLSRFIDGVCLQFDATEEEKAQFDNKPDISSWDKTYELIADLDAVVTVDTAVAHLAGSLGIKTYLLLAKLCDWRWGLSGSTTPWYPSTMIIRQEKLGDWSPVICNLKQLIQAQL